MMRRASTAVNRNETRRLSFTLLTSRFSNQFVFTFRFDALAKASALTPDACTGAEPEP
jgi:hypothetical protein